MCSLASPRCGLVLVLIAYVGRGAFEGCLALRWSPVFCGRVVRGAGHGERTFISVLWMLLACPLVAFLGDAKPLSISPVLWVVAYVGACATTCDRYSWCMALQSEPCSYATDSHSTMHCECVCYTHGSLHPSTQFPVAPVRPGIVMELTATGKQSNIVDINFFQNIYAAEISPLTGSRPQSTYRISRLPSR